MFELKSIYFNTAYSGPMPNRAEEKLLIAAERLQDPGSYDYEEWVQIPDRLRARFGTLLGAPSENIALSTSVSELVSHIAQGLTLSDGDEIILMEGDYPSMILPWLVLGEHRPLLKIRRLPSTVFKNPNNLKRVITTHTKFVACSHVRFNTGEQMPIAELGAVCRAQDILFLADVSQSFGGMTLSPLALKNVDILVGVTYKWLLGPYGGAFGYFSSGASV